ADEAHARQAVAPVPQRLLSSFDHSGMIRQAEIIVRAQIQDRLAARYRDLRLLWTGDHALALIETRLLDPAQLFLKMMLHRPVHGACSSVKMTAALQPSILAAADMMRVSLAL